MLLLFQWRMILEHELILIFWWWLLEQSGNSFSPRRAVRSAIVVVRVSRIARFGWIRLAQLAGGWTIHIVVYRTWNPPFYGVFQAQFQPCSGTLSHHQRPFLTNSIFEILQHLSKILCKRGGEIFFFGRRSTVVFEPCLPTFTFGMAFTFEMTLGLQTFWFPT